MPWDNPIWTYRSRPRWWRRLSASDRRVLTAVAVIAGAGTSFGTAWLLAGNPAPAELYACYSVLVAICASIYASAAVVQDRQRGTWDALVVSGLSPREIVLGKFVAALWPAALLALWTLPIWVVLFVTGPRGPWTGTSLAHWVVAVWAALRAVCRPLPFAAIGLYISFRSRSLPNALATMMGLLALLLLMSLMISEFIAPTPAVPYSWPYTFFHWLVFPPAPTATYWLDVIPTIGERLLIPWTWDIVADCLWLIVIPAVLLGYTITRFDRLDRKARGSAGGLRAPRTEALERNETPEDTQP